MRIVLASLFFVVSASVWGASAKQTVEELSSQVSPLWKAMRPACMLALDVPTQLAVESRLQFLDAQLVSQNLQQGLSSASQNRNAAWKSPSWALREQFEKAALAVEEREALREYFFKLQTQKPNKIRAQLIEEVRFVSEELNLALRQELWKTCHALGLDQIPPEQMEEVVQKRWEQQELSVATQLKAEISAFYFYAFRSVQNPELAVLSQLAMKLKPWAIDTSEVISQHFVALRANLLAMPMDAVTTHSTDEPFLEDRPWRQEPAPSPFQP